MIDEATYNDLDRYFHSDMNAEEKGVFESRMNASEDLRAEFVWLNIMLGSMKQQGRTVMKQSIASALASVPSGEVARYKPSVNGKSFLKKWWWAITGAVVAVGVAVAIYMYTSPTPHSESHDENHDVLPREVIPPTDSVHADSLNESMELRSDSVKAAIGKETAYVYFDDGDENALNEKKVGVAPVIGREDSMRVLAYSGTNSPTGSGGVPRDKNKPMFVIPGYKTQPPYTYTLGEDLTLNAPWRTTKGFKFEEVGDTVYMTDNDGLKYMLLRNQGVQMLEPMKGATK
jgi:hypothetical protein